MSNKPSPKNRCLVGEGWVGGTLPTSTQGLGVLLDALKQRLLASRRTVTNSGVVLDVGVGDGRIADELLIAMPRPWDTTGMSGSPSRRNPESFMHYGVPTRSPASASRPHRAGNGARRTAGRAARRRPGRAS